MEERARRLRFGIYVGEGASHSWTWFVDLLERYAYHRLRFLRAEDFADVLPSLDVLVLSGGDTFAVARALGSSGAEALSAFLERGGLYIGSCAGAYLPLHSSKEPLKAFNFVRAKINNLTRDLPPARDLPLKFSTPYGCSYVIHPVREEVRVRMAEEFPEWGGRELGVPLYGGPPLVLSEEITPAAFYSGFTQRTRFLADLEIAEGVYLGKVAACERTIGAGRMILLGPHFEHPGFPEGNAVVDAWIRWHLARSLWDSPCSAPGASRPPALSQKTLEALKLEVSNMRIRAWALARESVYWKIGAKIYEAEKIHPFVDAVWSRLASMKARGEEQEEPDAGPALLEAARRCHAIMRDLSGRLREGLDTQDLAELLFRHLKDFTADFLEAYFQNVARPASAREIRHAGGVCGRA
jgi:hypothetical protein